MMALLTRKMRGLTGRVQQKLSGAVQRYKETQVFRRTVAPFPATIYLAVNTRCGFSCKMCDVGMEQYDTQFYKIMSLSKEQPRDRLSLERLKALVDEVKDFKPMIAATSTEPLLYKDIISLCDYVVSNGLPMLVTTAGLQLEKHAESLVRVGVQHLWVSIDGPPEIHNDIRGVKDSFQKSVAGILAVDEWKRRLGREFPKMGINYAFSNYNFHCLERFMDAVHALPVDQITFSHMNYVTAGMAEVHNARFGHLYPTTVSSVSNADPTKVDVNVFWDQINRVKTRYPGRAMFGPDLDRKGLEDFYFHPEVFVHGDRCYVPWRAAEIIANGDCVVMTRCFHTSFGNINQQSFKDIWNGPSYQEFRKNLITHGTYPACSRCCGIL
jgi:MoaA/NifB/PqqE/SkfB family radical SAM enzyme